MSKAPLLTPQFTGIAWFGTDRLGKINIQGADDRAGVIDWYAQNRARSRQLFDLLSPDVYYSRPIALPNSPLVPPPPSKKISSLFGSPPRTKNV